MKDKEDTGTMIIIMAQESQKYQLFMAKNKPTQRESLCVCWGNKEFITSCQSSNGVPYS